MTDLAAPSIRPAMHVRWHVNRGLTRPGCTLCHPDLEVPEGHQVCNECALPYPKDRYHQGHAVCKTCYNRLLRQQGRDRRGEFLWAKYHLTLMDYDLMLSAQLDRCKLCLVHQDDEERLFVVDHDHACCPGSRSCGECIRALLCHRCNLTLGALDDDSELLRRMADYVEGRV